MECNSDTLSRFEWTDARQIPSDRTESEPKIAIDEQMANEKSQSVEIRNTRNIRNEHGHF